jgi:hypothetical protein
MDPVVIACQPISFAWYLVMSVRVELGGKKAGKKLSQKITGKNAT